MKQTFSKIFLGPAALLFIMLLSASVTFAQRASFSGDWKLDEKKSELGQFARSATSVKVDQKEDAITIAKVTPGFNGGEARTNTITLGFDGKVVQSEGFGGAVRKSTAKWSDDGKTLTITSNMNFERDGQSFEIKSTESWTLTTDGSLSVITTSTSSRGENTIKAIYTK